jgi:L-alanine-DL-glutamate epimerase-like enolase superfamily enzyme
MGLTLAHETLHLPLRDPFVIARSEHGAGLVTTTVIVELRDAGSGASGLGEGFPDRFYGETPETMAAVMPELLATIDRDVLAGDVDVARAALVATADAFDGVIRGHGAAKCALDIALHDLVARRLGIPVVELLDLPADIPPTDFTIGLDAPEVVAARARRAADFPALKIKVGGTADLETLMAVRAVYDGPIRVDANTGWTPDGAEALVPELVRLGVELIEQPFPARRLDQLRWLQERSPLPIVADESAVAMEDLDGLVGVVAGVNVKLAKCGGVGPAARMLARAKELGFRTFLGCMEETSIGIAASAAAASLADWVDLDGCLLLGEDPFEGLDLDGSKRWLIGGAPGLGVRRRDPG